METLGTRLRKARKEKGLTQPELGKASGVSKSAISQWETGLTKSMEGSTLLAVSKVLNVDPSWLITGDGEKAKGKASTGSVEISNYTLGTFDTWSSDTPLNDDEVAIPFYREIELAAGSGRTMIQENNGFKLRFSKSTLSKSNVDAGMAACVTVSGNSMEPVLPDGSTIGIDTSKVAIKDGDMYAIDHDGQLRVKMVYRMPSGIRLKSFNNDEWPDENYNAEDSQKIKVLGRVFWWSVLR